MRRVRGYYTCAYARHAEEVRKVGREWREIQEQVAAERALHEERARPGWYVTD